MELKLINGKWQLVSENGKTETYFELPCIKRLEFILLLECEIIYQKYKIKPPTETEIFIEDLKETIENTKQLFKEFFFGLIEIITKREPKFIDEYDYEIYEQKYWNK